ncbi:cytochrome c biogenesis CcdA family protein [Brachybacterium saurashtrense]|uniref:Cytochrome c biogenesis protein CcdA n=1 Tax=Brachybacterium saurashtrense TaxID=556288 RepID=A0A345YPI8_9MICO|nr:cytochrome c biogenesis protein CcdA [Brachybacterium saurashtrense]AXK45840.1 cytochrome c biogenesis protein CcdA [Brachybacterium saurashtrense]RRR24859.1 cytochrome c biogenesis protein CcdA [Brachybacterium saurashtrense]
MTLAEIGSAFQATALSGAILPALAVAAAAGLVAFLSPCVLPVVPGYLGYVSGLAGQGTSGASARTRPATGRMLAGSALFVAGFTVVFLILGGFAGALGYLLQEYALWIDRVAGAIVILMGLVFMGVIPGLSGTRRVSTKRPDAGLLGAPVMGLIFGLSWTPCIGPTYAAIVALSLDGGDGAVLRGALLSLAYSLGLGIPFVLFALLFDRALGVSRKLAAHRRTIGLLSGALLIAIGVLLMTGVWADWMSRLQGMISTFEPVV